MLCVLCLFISRYFWRFFFTLSRISFRIRMYQSISFRNERVSIRAKCVARRSESKKNIDIAVSFLYFFFICILSYTTRIVFCTMWICSLRIVLWKISCLVNTKIKELFEIRPCMFSMVNFLRLHGASPAWILTYRSSSREQLLSKYYNFNLNKISNCFNIFYS